MKINITLLAIVVFVFASCSKSVVTQSYYMNALVSNNAYTAPNCIARPQGNSLLIEGLGPSGSLHPVYPYILLVIPNWHPQVDSIQLDSLTYKSYAQYLTAANQVKISASGVLVINSLTSNTISGRFQFVCTDSTIVDSGAFKAQLTQ